MIIYNDNSNNCNNVYRGIIDEIQKYDFGAIKKLVLSAPKTGVIKVSARPIALKRGDTWQFETFKDDKVYHKNIQIAEFGVYLLSILTEYNFHEINILLHYGNIRFHVTKRGKLMRSTHGDVSYVTDPARQTGARIDHDRQKSYILAEGTPIMPFVELGVFDNKFRVVKSKYDKFRQINRFIEIIADEFKGDACAITNSSSDIELCGADSTRVGVVIARGDADIACGDADIARGDAEFTIVDFGCGKSYLTFFMYYYFTTILKMNVRIVGYDIKEDVVKRCNEIAVKYGYEKLSFFVGDVAGIPDIPPGCAGRVDMIIALHACDTATDHALHYAIKNGVKRIFSVPCCQHEINARINNESEFTLLLRHGLFKERFSALLTDCIRCDVLRCAGYSVDAVEFVDFEHTPKNVMIRAHLNGDAKRDISISDNLSDLLRNIHSSQKLVDLVFGRI